MQPVSGSLMLFLSCQDKNVYWISLKSNILKGIINPWNQNVCTWTSLQVLRWLHLSHDPFNYCILATEPQVNIKVNIQTKIKKSMLKSMLKFFPKLQQKHMHIWWLKIRKMGYLIRIHKHFIITSHFCSTLFLKSTTQHCQNNTHAEKMTEGLTAMYGRRSEGLQTH